MGRSFHVHSEKAGLIISVVQQWPVTWIKGHDGKPFDHLPTAVQAIIDLPSKYVPYCPTPDEEGKCPGHLKDDAS